MVPWRNVTTSPATAMTTAVMYDTASSYGMLDSRSYQTIDITTIDPIASGYQYGWVDENNNVWFVPDGNYAVCTATSMICSGVLYPPFIVWNSSLPFTATSSWTTYPSVISATQRGKPSTGAAYDPSTNTAYSAPWGNLMTQVQIFGSAVPTPTINPATPTPTAKPISSPTPTPIKDSTSPTVSITSPLSGQIILRNSTYTIAATASDNTNVTEVTFLVNGSLICTDTVAPYTCAWNLTGKPNATNTIQVTAYDAAGNTGSATVTVTSSSN